MATSDEDYLEPNGAKPQTDGDAESGKADDISSEKEKDASLENEESSDFRYGWFGWHPKWLQGFNKASWLLVILCGFSTAQVM